MDDADTLSLLVFALCLMCSSFFSGSETAITSFGDRKAHRLREEGGREGKLLGWWLDSPVEVLTTILLGNNVVNTLMGATATAMTIRHLGDTQYAGWAVPVAVFITTVLVLIFGEIVPKALGKLLSPKAAIPALTILHGLSRLFLPFVWILARITDRVIRRAHDPAQNGARVTSGELGYLVKVAEREGTIPAEQAQLLQQVFRFEEKIVRDIMVPRDRVVAVDLTWPLDKILRVAQATGHSRLPVYEGHIDKVRGVLHIKQIVGLQTTPEVSASESSIYRSIEKLLRKPFFVSESLLIHDLLRRFKEERAHLAIVVDDAGDTVGVVTLEDVIEQLVGQIFDESDRAPAQAPPDRGVKYLDGQSSLAKVEEALNVEFEEIDGVSSIGDMLTRLAGQMPVAGSVFVWEGVRFKVLAADATRIVRVSVERVEIEDDED